MNKNNSNNLGLSNQTIEKVLVVVDFQNGFIKGGSFGSHNNSKINELDISINQSNQIERLIDDNNNIIFTRDFHPVNHLSIGNYNPYVPGANATNKKILINFSTTWPSHCTNTGSVCDRTHNMNENGTINTVTNYSIQNQSALSGRTYMTIGEYLNKYTKENFSGKNKVLPLKSKFNRSYLEQPIIGTNISFLMLATKYAPQILELINANTPIGILGTNKNTDPDLTLINPNPIAIPIPSDNKTIAQLVKGQYCKYESHSAFNYHWAIKLSKPFNTTKSNKNKLAQYKLKYITKEYLQNNNLLNLSTGLFEYILRNEKKQIEITVCGLVGEVCVIRSVTEGLIMWYCLYKNMYPNKKVIFNYSLAGTLFTGIPALGFTHEIPSIEEFKSEMITYLSKTDNVDPEFRKYIKFNVLDYNGEYLTSIGFDGSIFKEIPKITFTNVNRNTNNAKVNGNRVNGNSGNVKVNNRVNLNKVNGNRVNSGNNNV